jgi:hypothetical protein
MSVLEDLMFTVRVLQPNPDGFHDFGSSKEKLLQADDVHFGPGWVMLVNENADGSITRTTLPIDLIVEIVETITAREVRAAKRVLKGRDEDAHKTMKNKGVRDPGYG